MILIPWPNAQFVIYPRSDKGVAHIATPDFLRHPLFTTYESAAFCGNGATVKQNNSYTPDEAEFHTDIPAGYTLCKYCATRVVKEILPYVS